MILLDQFCKSLSESSTKRRKREGGEAAGRELRRLSRREKLRTLMNFLAGSVLAYHEPFQLVLGRTNLEEALRISKRPRRIAPLMEPPLENHPILKLPVKRAGKSKDNHHRQQQQHQSSIDCGNRSVVKAKIGSYEIECQFDSGADFNILRKDLYDLLRLEMGVRLKKDSEVLEGIGQSRVRTIGLVTVKTDIGGNVYNLAYRVVPTEILPMQILLGDPFLDHARIILDKDGATIGPIGEGYILLVRSEKDWYTIAEVPRVQRRQVEKLIEEHKPPEADSKVPVEIRLIFKEKKQAMFKGNGAKRLSPCRRNQQHTVRILGFYYSDENGYQNNL